MPRTIIDTRPARALVSAPYPLPNLITRPKASHPPSSTSITAPTPPPPTPPTDPVLLGFPPLDPDWKNRLPAVGPVPYPPLDEKEREERERRKERVEEGLMKRVEEGLRKVHGQGGLEGPLLRPQQSLGDSAPMATNTSAFLPMGYEVSIPSSLFNLPPLTSVTHSQHHLGPNPTQQPFSVPPPWTFPQPAAPRAPTPFDPDQFLNFADDIQIGSGASSSQPWQLPDLPQATIAPTPRRLGSAPPLPSPRGHESQQNQDTSAAQGEEDSDKTPTRATFAHQPSHPADDFRPTSAPPPGELAGSWSGDGGDGGYDEPTPSSHRGGWESDSVTGGGGADEEESLSASSSPLSSHLETPSYRLSNRPAPDLSSAKPPSHFFGATHLAPFTFSSPRPASSCGDDGESETFSDSVSTRTITRIKRNKYSRAQRARERRLRDKPFADRVDKKAKGRAARSRDGDRHGECSRSKMGGHPWRGTSLGFMTSPAEGPSRKRSRTYRGRQDSPHPLEGLFSDGDVNEDDTLNQVGVYVLGMDGRPLRHPAATSWAPTIPMSIDPHVSPRSAWTRGQPMSIDPRMSDLSPHGGRSPTTNPFNEFLHPTSAPVIDYSTPHLHMAYPAPGFFPPTQQDPLTPPGTYAPYHPVFSPPPRQVHARRPEPPNTASLPYAKACHNFLLARKAAQQKRQRLMRAHNRLREEHGLRMRAIQELSRQWEQLDRHERAMDVDPAWDLGVAMADPSQHGLNMLQQLYQHRHQRHQKSRGSKSPPGSQAAGKALATTQPFRDLSSMAAVDTSRPTARKHSSDEDRSLPPSRPRRQHQPSPLGAPFMYRPPTILAAGRGGESSSSSGREASEDEKWRRQRRWLEEQRAARGRSTRQ